MSKKGSSGNILIYVILGVVVLFVFFKFIGPRIGIEPFKDRGNSIEYVHSEGFPKVINVTEQFNKTRLVITDEQKLKEAIAAVDKNNEVKLPKINFDRKIALFVTSKTRGTGGYETRIKKIEKDKEDLIVRIRDTEPGKTCLTTEQFNLPMDLVVLDKTDLSIEFEVERFVKECN